MSNRGRLAAAAHSSGLLRFHRLIGGPRLVVLNYHRIGNPMECQFDRGVFSASQDIFYRQCEAFVRWGYSILSLEEILEASDKNRRLSKNSLLLTFDDGYLDNYDLAFPILKSLNLPAAFFLVPTFVGSNIVPWWDEIAYCVRNCELEMVRLSYPIPAIVRCQDREAAILAVLRLFKSPQNTDHEKFMCDLRKETGVVVPVQQRRFLSWVEAEQMQAAGMSIGSHTYTHRLLSQLSALDQEDEMLRSRAAIQAALGSGVRALAYPVGARDSYTGETQRIAKEAGYDLAFSFHGGARKFHKGRRFEVPRMEASTDFRLLRFEMACLSQYGKLPY